MNDFLRIPVIEGAFLDSGKIPTLVGVMPLQALVLKPLGSQFDHRLRMNIPRSEFKEHRGYQRKLSPKRVNDLKRELRGNAVDLPTAILLNRRDVKLEDLTEVSDGQRFLLLDQQEQNPEPFYVVDGQHRLCALQELSFDDYLRWQDFPLPFVCMVGATEIQEMRQFYVVNSTAKSVKTDLAYLLIKQQAEQDPRVLESLVAQDKAWQVTGQEIVEAVAERAPWQGRIRFANDRKGNTTVTNSAFITSLRPLLSQSLVFRSQCAGQQAEILAAYWRGIQRCLPEPFDNPQEYALQKGPGIFSLHSVFAHVFEYLRATGLAVTDPESYQSVMEELLQQLEGDTPSGERVFGVDFWRSSDGGASIYSSHAGRRVLAARIEKMLPTIPLGD